MNITVFPGRLAGEINSIESKSKLHRLLIASALAGGSFSMGRISDDIKATSECLDSLFSEKEGVPCLNCGESATTLRLLLPIALVIKDKVVFKMKRSLFERPMSPLTDELSNHGCSFSFNAEDCEISAWGSLTPGNYKLPGDISSQYVSGLLFALPLLKGSSRIELTSPLQSKGYVDMTLEVLEQFNVKAEAASAFFEIPGGQAYQMPGEAIAAEGDWSAAAPFLCANSLGSEIKINGLSEESLQGDRKILHILETFDNPGDRILDVSDIPDLLPCLAVRACFAEGQTKFVNASRLRFKESDRLKTTSEMLKSLGGDVEIAGDQLIVTGTGKLSGGFVRSAGDHRIVMAATLAGAFAEGPVTISDAESVSKSYPEFFDDFKKLKGKTEMGKIYSFGNNIKVEIYGGSHEPEIGAAISGLPAGTSIDTERLHAFMKRRSPGKAFTSARREADIPHVEKLSENGTAYKITIANDDVKPEDYEKTAVIPRPGHADYSSFVKYGRIPSGGGAFSGRMTAALCAAGGIALQLLEKRGITVGSHIFSIGDIYDEPFVPAETDEKILKALKTKVFPVNSEAAEKAMLKAVENAAAEKDSLGGIIEIAVIGLKAGIGGPLFEGLESRISEILFAIPAVKGVEFGTGFAASTLKGSENNDPFMIEDGKVKTATNHHGGILGGISTGMPLIARTAFKPTPSIGQPQQSVNLKTLNTETFTIEGRHDPCIVLRAAPACEAAVALALLDALQETEETTLEEIRSKIDNIDDRILDLFEKRMSLGLKASAQKEKSNMPVLDSGREEEILKKVGEKLDISLEDYGRELFEKLMQLSRDYQESSRKDK